MLIKAGGDGLSVAFDMPTLMGRDSDDPRSLGEVGHCGVAIDSAADMDVLFDGIPLDQTTTSMTISGPAVPVFCMYLVAAERQGIDIAHARRNAADRHLQGVHRAEGVALRARAAPAPDRRPDGVLRAAHSRATSRFRSPAITSGRPARRPRRSSRSPWPTASATWNSASPAASTSTSSPPACRSSSTRTSTSSRRSRSSAPPAVSGPAGSATSTARRPPAPSGCGSTPRPPGVSLTAQQPVNNVVRTAIEALAAVLGGTNSLHTNALDEVLALPSAAAAETALRTQQVIVEETERRQRRRPARRLLVRRGAHRPA